MKIIGFVGLPGSGKGEASKIARELGLSVVVMGDVIRQEAAGRVWSRQTRTRAG